MDSGGFDVPLTECLREYTIPCQGQAFEFGTKCEIDRLAICGQFPNLDTTLTCVCSSPNVYSVAYPKLAPAFYFEFYDYIYQALMY